MFKTPCVSVVAGNRANSRNGVIAAGIVVVGLLLSLSTGCGGAQSGMLPANSKAVAATSRDIPVEDDNMNPSPSPSPSKAP